VVQSETSQRGSGSAGGVCSERERQSAKPETLIKGLKNLVSCQEYRRLLYSTPVCLLLAREHLGRQDKVAMLVAIREMLAFVTKLKVA